MGKFVAHKFKKLIIPFYIWNLVYGILVWGLRYLGFTIGGAINFDNLVWQPIIHGHKFVYNMGSWFVVPLFMVQIFHVLIRKMFKVLSINKNEWLLAVVCTLIGFGGVWLAKAGYNQGGWLAVVRFLFLFLFMNGEYCTRKNWKRKTTCLICYTSVLFLRFS